MDGMEDKLNAILGNPQMMQQIMSMAQAMGQQEEQRKEPPPQNNAGGLDLAMIQKLSGIAKQSSIDKNQQNLLRALSPYLSRERIAKLERAMRAAKIAGIASTALAGSGISLLSGR
ncbi:MAG: hypothetical protein IJZ15_00835 [Oscillospiraceae bacterium]|nr:hypothetical protein [Oscillospiraceae bacterium]